MITVTGAYIIEYRPGGLYLGEKDGALNLQTIPEHPTIFEIEEVKQGLYALRARDKYLAQGNSNTLTLVSKDQRGAWPISPVDEFDDSERYVGDRASGFWVVDDEKNKLSVKKPADISDGPATFNFLRIYRDD